MKPLFITPFGGRTGSEMMLWYYLDFLKTTPDKPILYARRRGELVDENCPADITYHSKKKDSFLYKIYEGFYNKLIGHVPDITQLTKIHKRHQPDFWYLNTIMMPDVATLAVKLGVRYVLHVHESITVYDELRATEAALMLKNAAKIICCSESSRSYLLRMGYEAEVSYSFIDKDIIKITEPPLSMRAKLNIPAEAFIWVMSGTMSLRKGYDLIPEVLENLPPHTYLVWIGRESPTGIWHYIQKSVISNGLNFVHIPSQSADYYNYLNIADGFVLLSREEPLGLVIIEAAFLQIPIVGFNAGGIQEIMVDGMGVVVPENNVKQLTAHMKAVQDGSLRLDKAVMKNRALDFDKTNQINQWYQTLKKI